MDCFAVLPLAKIGFEPGWRTNTSPVQVDVGHCAGKQEFLFRHGPGINEAGTVSERSCGDDDYSRRDRVRVSANRLSGKNCAAGFFPPPGLYGFQAAIVGNSIGEDNDVAGPSYCLEDARLGRFNRSRRIQPCALAVRSCRYR